MIREARLKHTETGLVPAEDGWFVLNAQEARWDSGEGRGARLRLEGDTDFAQVGINLYVLAPGEPMAVYHWEDLGRSLVTLGERDEADGQVWHLPRRSLSPAGSSSSCCSRRPGNFQRSQSPRAR